MLRSIGKVMAMTAEKTLSRLVEHGHPPEAAGTEEPCPLPAVIAQGALKGDGLLHRLPFSAVTMKEI